MSPSIFSQLRRAWQLLLWWWWWVWKVHWIRPLQPPPRKGAQNVNKIRFGLLLQNTALMRRTSKTPLTTFSGYSIKAANFRLNKCNRLTLHICSKRRTGLKYCLTMVLNWSKDTVSALAVLVGYELGEPSKLVSGKTWDFVPTRGGGGLPIPSCYHFFPKLNLPWNCQ